MGRSRTAGITVDAGGNRIICKTVSGIQLFARLGAVSQEQAEAELARLVREAQENVERGRRTRRTFGQACVHYLSLDEIKAKRSVDTDAYHIALLEPYLGDLELSAIHDDAPKLKEFKKHRLDVDEVSMTTLKRSLEVLRRILRLASMKWRNEDGTPWLATPLNVLQLLGGWASLEMVQRYAHLDTTHLQPWVDRRTALESPAAPAEIPAPKKKATEVVA